jgi:hypothetical protein
VIKIQKKERHSREFNCRSSETSVGNRTKAKVAVGKSTGLKKPAAFAGRGLIFPTMVICR